MFLLLMAAGLIGLTLMAIPGLARHGHVGTAGHGLGHTGHLHAGATAHSAGHGLARGARTGVRPQGPQQEGTGADGAIGMSRFLPSPRLIFSLLALYGAFGYALNTGAHLTLWPAALLATIPALLLERFVMTPWWNRMMSYQGDPCSPLESLVTQEAEAVTPFRNGKGVVAVEHDGRLVQFSATLPPGQSGMPVRVGDKLRIEEVDTVEERVQVSLR